VPVSPGSGSSNFYANAATVENKGIELALSYKVLLETKMVSIGPYRVIYSKQK
jgi:outer membrane receptor protein involved in Fe transport